MLAPLYNELLWQLKVQPSKLISCQYHFIFAIGCSIAMPQMFNQEKLVPACSSKAEVCHILITFAPCCVINMASNRVLKACVNHSE